MKKCSKCNRTYDDDELNFCLVDGNLLSLFMTSYETSNNPTSEEITLIKDEKKNQSELPQELLKQNDQPQNKRLSQQVSESGKSEKVIELVNTWIPSLQNDEQLEIRVMLSRLRELEKKQRVFGVTKERQAEIWEIYYDLDRYFNNRLGLSLL